MVYEMKLGGADCGKFTNAAKITPEPTVGPELVSLATPLPPSVVMPYTYAWAGEPAAPGVTSPRVRLRDP